MKRKKKRKMPKPRIPIAPPSIRMRSKKDYQRKPKHKKKIDKRDGIELQYLTDEGFYE